MDFYSRNLPHWQPNNAEFFVTFRLANSLPKPAVDRIKSDWEILKQEIQNYSESENKEPDNLIELRKKQKLLFKKYEKRLDKAETGPTWLSNPEVANLVCQAIHYRDNDEYDLYAFCVMPNHVHMVFQMLRENKEERAPAVTKMLQSLKWFTAYKANEILNREGQFWQHESFDRYIRDQEELESTIKYVLNNPVKAGLIEDWQEWPYSYHKPEFENILT